MQKAFLKTVLIVLMIAFNNAYPNPFWCTQQTPVNITLGTCSFPDSVHGWAAGKEGKIIYTSNGELNWVEQNSPVNFPISCIHFINERLGWGVANDYFGEGTKVLSTTNGGLNWSTSSYPGKFIYFYTIYFHDSLNGWMDGTKIVRTTNGGANWHTCLSSYVPIHDLKFCNSNLGFVCGGFIGIAGYILKSTDKGVNWEFQAASPEPLNDIFIFDSLNIISVGGDYEYGVTLAKTTNGGLNWTCNSLSIFGIAYAVSFRTLQEGWIALGFTEEMAYTTNSGTNWTTIPSPDSTAIYDITFVDENHGWAVGENGTVLRYDTMNTGIKNFNQNNYVTSFYLYQNYPNPFNPKTKINIQITKSSDVRLVVYDVLGREIETLINKQLQPGTYEFEFDGSNYTSGVYFYRIETRDFVDVRKMILLK
jgi:photosystem II stability/assembly factor-like uncharacterized protein